MDGVYFDAAHKPLRSGGAIRVSVCFAYHKILRSYENIGKDSHQTWCRYVVLGARNFNRYYVADLAWTMRMPRSSCVERSPEKLLRGREDLWEFRRTK